MKRLAGLLPALEDHARTLGVAGVVAAVLLVVWALFAPAAPFQGWLIAYAFWSSIGIGALALWLIHALTGGRWGWTVAPALLPMLGAMPLLALLFLPLLLGLSYVYPWAARPETVAPDVARLYLNTPFFIARSALALAGWTFLAWLVLRASEQHRPLVAALGLAFHGLAISLIAVDWLLSVEPHFTSSDFAADIGVTQLLAALAWSALLQPPSSNARHSADLAALLIATTLGTLYLAFMQYVVVWYGDLPDKVTWYLARNSGGWAWLGLAALVLSMAAPFAALVFQPVRRSPFLLRTLGLCVLIGLWLRMVWLLAPAFGPMALLTGPLATIAIGGLWLGFAYRTSRPSLRAEMAHE